MGASAGEQALAPRIGNILAEVDASRLPKKVRETVRLLVLDVAGLCVAARRTDYVKAALASAASTGKATAIGHEAALGPYDAALINGTAAHGEDYDDTFEGGPVHSGAVVVPAVLAIAEHRGLGGDAVVKGIAAGVEIMCRTSLVAPQAIHKACFHPTAVLGALGAAAGVGAALSLDGARIAHAIGTPAASPRESSSIWLTEAGPSGCIRAPRRSRAFAPPCWRRLDSRARVPCSKASTASTKRSLRRADPISRPCSMASARAGSSRTSPSSRTRAGR